MNNIAAFLSSSGIVFHSAAADVSSNRLPYLTVLLRFDTSDVVDAERNGREGVYQFNNSHIYCGV